MKLELYKEISDKFSNGNTLNSVIAEYPEEKVGRQILEGIYQRVTQSVGRRRIWKFESLNIPVEELLERFLRLHEKDEENRTVLERLSRQHHCVPPCYLARLVVKAFVEREYPRKILSPDLLDQLDQDRTNNGGGGGSGCEGEKKTGRPSATKLYRNPEEIPHQGLSMNVQHCHQIDPYFSPAMDEYRNRIGREYEDVLNGHLDALGIAYLDEPGMRRMGYSRTPDVVLLEPIAVDGRIVKWIESKAWFADPPSHATYLRDQYWPYYNRFGPGLVIYWFGFVEEVVDSHLEKGVAVMDHFPLASQITRIESSMATLIERCRDNVRQGT